MRHSIYFLILFFPLFIAAQVISPINPFTKDFVPSASNKGSATTQSLQQIEPTFAEIEKAFDAYWEGKDHTVKGSGYKPFKRWIEHWRHYQQEDGTIAPPQVLWDAWEKKQQAEAQGAPLGVPDDTVIDWVGLGPTEMINPTPRRAGQGRLNTIIQDPNTPTTLYVGAPAGGIWKSVDDGINWTPLSDHLPQIGVSGIAIDPTDSNVIYISTGDDDASDSTVSVL